MLLSVRENLKNKVVFGIVLFVMIIMVIGGVGSVNLNSIGGNSVAEVGGEDVTPAEVDREVSRRRSQLESQGMDPSSEFMQLENIRQQVLPQLLSRKALVATAKKGSMGVSDEVINDIIRNQSEFQVDGKFDLPTYRRVLAQANFNPATYKDYLIDEYFVRQQILGLNQSAFLTDSELNQLVRIVKEKRKFFEIIIPQTEVENSIVVTPEEIQTYYDENQSMFNVPSTVTVDYIEVSLDEIAKSMNVSDQEVRDEYQAEVAAFNTQGQSAKAEYEIAHILISDSDEAEEKIAAVQKKVDEGVSFDELAKNYSDDVGNKDAGGSLGVLTPNVFPKPFEEAVYTLDEGEISSPVKTDAGTHFIKVVSKSVTEAPSFEDREAAIRLSLQRVKAEEIYIETIAQLEELSFGNKELAPIAEELDVEVKTSEPFQASSGNGIASNAKVRNASFNIDVLENGNNSPLIELSNGQALVVRINTYEPAHVAPLESVQTRIVETLKSEKTQTRLSEIAIELRNKIKAGESAQEIAKQASYEFKQHELTERTDVNSDFLVLRSVFEVPAPVEGSSAIAFGDVKNSKGNRTLIGLQEVVPGNVDELSEQEKQAFKSQLLQENASLSIGAYQASVLDEYDIELPK